MQESVQPASRDEYVCDLYTAVDEDVLMESEKGQAATSTQAPVFQVPHLGGSIRPDTFCLALSYWTLLRQWIKTDYNVASTDFSTTRMYHFIFAVLSGRKSYHVCCSRTVDRPNKPYSCGLGIVTLSTTSL